MEMELGFYRHYKGTLYEVLYVVKNADNNYNNIGGLMVVYREVNNMRNMYVCPIHQFNDSVFPHTGTCRPVHRFELIQESKQVTFAESWTIFRRQIKSFFTGKP